MTTQDPISGTTSPGIGGSRAAACPPGPVYTTASAPPPPGAAAQATPRQPTPEQAQIPGDEPAEKLTGNPAVDAMAKISGSIGELKEYAGYLMAAKMDGIKSSIRNVGLYAAIGMVGLIVGGAILATAGVLLVVGIAQALAALFNRMWLGNLVTAVLILGLLGVG